MLHPDFPVVEGRYQMTSHWAVTLPLQFNRRIEDGALVFWRPGVTAWTIVMNNDQGESQQERLEWLRGETSPDAFEAQSVSDGAVIRYCYRLTEPRDQEVVHALYGFAIGVNGHVQMAIYADDEADLESAKPFFGALSKQGGLTTAGRTPP